MLAATIDRLVRSAKRVAIIGAAIVLFGALIIAFLWQDRPALVEIDWPPHPSATAVPGAVTATWLGVSTLLFDDGETQVLIDGFFSRPSVFDLMLLRPVHSEAARIDYVLNNYRMRRLAAIIPVHSHFDHAMDIGAIANRSSASILGSSTTVQIARGANVPEDQIVLARDRAKYKFGDFTVTMINSTHAPVAWGGATPLAGVIEKPLMAPAPVTAWREGKSYSILIEHPHGTTLVQGSAGFIEGAMADIRADVVMLGVGQLKGIGYEYAERYWKELVTTTGAKRVFPIHFDDFTKPFGTIELPPRVLGNFVKTTSWLETFRDTWDKDTRLHIPEFGIPMILYPQEPPEA